MSNHVTQSPPTLEIVSQLLEYDPETGIFRFKVDRSNMRAGDIAGHLHRASGYWKVAINSKNYGGHMVAWLFLTGSWPKMWVDHRNNIRHDNRADNLRLSTRSQNCRNSKTQRNNTTMCKGVSPSGKGKFRARIFVDGKRLCLGTFPTAEQAHDRYCEAAARYYGDFARFR